MDKLLTEREAADYLRLSTGTMQNMRYAGAGPPHTKLPSGSIRYLAAELEAWINSGRGDADDGLDKTG